jgi:cyclophilin family peptidyl-prolyl cis-trans isomerase
MAQEWYYRENGQQHGPVTGAELKQLAAAGQLKPDDKVKREGKADWLLASQVKGLFPNMHDKVQQKADAVGKTAGTVSKVAKAAGKVSDAVSDVAEAGDKVQKAVKTVAGIAAGGSALAGSIGDFLRPLGPINLVIFAAALLSGGVLFVLAKKRPAVKVKFRLQSGAVASLAVAVIFGLWTGLGAVAGKGDNGFLATNVRPVEQLQAAVVPTRQEREPAKTEQPATKANPVALLKTSMGDIRIELFADKAPKTVANFLAYAEDGFYDGTIFHRVVPNFTIQGGGYEPGLREKKPTRPPVPSESNNGLSNVAGTLAMARAGGADSATTQFFINVNDNSGILDRAKAKDGVGYCVFGRVVGGMDVLDRIKGVQAGSRNGQSNVPIQDVKILSIRRE